MQNNCDAKKQKKKLNVIQMNHYNGSALAKLSHATLILFSWYTHNLSKMFDSLSDSRSLLKAKKANRTLQCTKQYWNGFRLRLWNFVQNTHGAYRRMLMHVGKRKRRGESAWKWIHSLLNLNYSCSSLYGMRICVGEK